MATVLRLAVLADVCALLSAILVFFITLRTKLSGVVCCYRSCLWRADGVCVGGGCLFVDLLPR